MQTIDIILLIAGLCLVVAGYIVGFGKTLKAATGGVVGVIISIIICAAFGGMILGISFVNAGVAKLNGILASKWDFLGKIQLAVIIFYIIMFIVVQIIRVVTVKFICSLFEKDKKAVKVVNRGLGMLFLPSLAFVLLLLVLAVIKIFDGSALVEGMFSEIKGSILYKLYLINPIVLHV